MHDKILCVQIKTKVIFRSNYNGKETEFLQRVTDAYASLGLGWEADFILEDMQVRGLITLKEDLKALSVYKTEALSTISAAYKRLALKYHPDRNPSPDDLEKFKEISAANTLISDYFIAILCTPTIDLIGEDKTLTSETEEGNDNFSGPMKCSFQRRKSLKRLMI